jgi:hypothetical protein
MDRGAFDGNEMHYHSRAGERGAFELLMFLILNL